MHFNDFLSKYDAYDVDSFTKKLKQRGLNESQIFNELMTCQENYEDECKSLGIEAVYVDYI